MGDYQKALKYFKKQLKIATEIDDHGFRRKCLSQHWIIYSCSLEQVPKRGGQLLFPL